MAEVLPIVYTQAQANRDKRVYQKWIEDGYPKLKAMVDDNIARWQAVRLIAQNALNYTRGSISGTIEESDEMTDTVLDEFVITLDCCPVAPGEIENLNLETDPQNIERIKSVYAKKIWDAVAAADTQYKIANPDGCSPQLLIDIISSYGALDIVSFEWESRGGVGAVTVDEESIQTVHMLTKDLDGDIYGVTGGWVEECAFALSFGEGAARQAFRYPSGEAYNLATIPAPNLNEIVELPIDMRISGRLIEIPDSLGCTVTPAVSGWMNGGMEIEDGWHFAAWVMNYQYQDWLFARRRPPASNPYFCDVLPAGYQKFLSLYVDHPMVTRENIYPVVSKTPQEEEAELEEVQVYVNSTFERFIDEYEDWHFLNPQTFTNGDCEDFALTKAQMLIEKCWDVKRLKLEGGWYSYLPDIGEDPEIQWQGHMWLVVDDAIALDVNGDSLATLRARYYERRVMQSNEIFDSATVPGKKICWWEQVDDHALLYKSADQRMIKIEPYPTVSFDMPMWDLTGEIERTK